MNKELWKEKTKALFNINQWTLFWCIYDEKDKEIERLNNIIEELEKNFINDDRLIKEYNIEHPENTLDNYSKYYLDKLKELKEGKE